MQYLMIRNPGLAPVKGFTTLGVSTTRFNGSEGTIGTFGSGSKHAINLLLRNDIGPIIFVGNLKLEFFTKPAPVDDGLYSHTYSTVCVKFGGKDEEGKSRSSTEDLGFVLEHGTADWTDVSMGVREFVSNALDRSYREFGNYDQAEISVVDKPRAKAGYTSVFILLTPEIQKFYRELPKRFLHFYEKDSLKKKILKKNGRSLSGKNTTMIYKKGVFIREFTENDLPSVFDYNLGEELRLDESRNADPYVVKTAVSMAIANAMAEELVPILKSVAARENTFESSLDQYYLKYPWGSETNKEKRKQEWGKAWKAVAGESGVAVSNKPAIADYVGKKGYNPVVIAAENWFSALEEHGVLTDTKVLTEAEKRGSVISDPTPDMLEAVDKIWNLFLVQEMTNGKDKPPVKAFDEVMDAGGQRLGYYSDGVVYIHRDMGVGQSPMLLQTALEEVVHYVTGASDMSRDFQDFIMRLMVKIAL